MKTINAVSLFLMSRQAKGLSPQTIRWYRGILDRFTQVCPELPAHPDPIERFLSQCTAGDERRHGYFRAVRVFYKWAHKRFKLVNPVDMIDPPRRKPKRQQFLIPDQLEQLLSFPHPPIIKAALLFLTDTGCRIGELAHLKPEDLIETPEGYIAKVTGKTGERFVPISRAVYTALESYLPLPYTRYRLRIKVARAFRNAHVPGTSKTLRHTFGTLWDGDELVLQQIMGHAYLSTTLIYRHLRIKRLSEQHHQFTPLRYIFARTKTML